MKAEIGKRYAQIINGRVHWTFTSTDLPEWQDTAFQVIDITDQSEVQTGYVPNQVGGFDPPPPPPTPPPLKDIVDQVVALSDERKLILKTLLK